MKKLNVKSAFPVLFVAVLLTAFGGGRFAVAQDGSALECDWNPNDPHKMHWPQLPDLGSAGMDVDMSLLFLADDFRCMATSPINDIHFWASFRDDVLPPDGPDSLTFEITIYSDIPATESSWSMPGELLWSRTFSPDEYSVRKLDDSPEGWYEPAIELYLPDNHRGAYQYNFCIEEVPFIQERGTVYWLSVKELAPANANYKFGWKTTTHSLRWNDDAVYFLAGKLVSFPLTYPKDHEYAGESLDLAFVITGGEEGQGEHDLGDAPDSSNSFPGATMLAYPAPGVVGNYPTVYEIGSPPYGPIHLFCLWRPDAMFHLGQTVTNESEADFGYDEDIKNNLVPRADLSDLDGGDDGVSLPLVLPHCQQTMFDYTVTVLARDLSMAVVNVWCDWNRDGDWDDVEVCPDGTTVPEWAVQNQQLLFTGPGIFTITTLPFMCWHPQTDVELDPMWMRITIAEGPWGDVAGGIMHGGAGPAGGYEYGETEDYLIYPRREGEPLEYDWGDAPTGTVAAGYPTLAFNNGANHVIAGPWLGDENDKPDSEPDGQPDSIALGDDNAGNDDENGVTIPPLIRGETADVTLDVRGGGGIVRAWIDFNGDKTWQAAEQIYDGFLPSGAHTISFSVPTSAVLGQTFARFRISKQGGLSPEGPAPDGEVEDYNVFIEEVSKDLKWVQWADLTRNGIDIRIDNMLQSIADDFECTNNNRITTVSLWGSWKNDNKGKIKQIHLSICSDDPTGPAGQEQDNKFSKPDSLLWSRAFSPDEFQEALYHVVREPGEWWWDPVSGEWTPGGDSEVWRIDVYINPDEAFVQQGSPDNPMIYWLKVQVETEDGEFGWKTRQWPDHYMDDAVWEVFFGLLPHNWKELRYPKTHPYHSLEKNSIDMAFQLTYTEEGPPQPTSRPVSATQCPVVQTQCPTVATQCPPVNTQCPTVQTQCPAVETECPPLETRCPPKETECSLMPTMCEGAATQCPAIETQCPAVQTQCVAVTMCPPVNTTCPVVNTQCPVEKTICPESSTNCPVVQTQCPAVETECPPLSTKCPPKETECSLVPTICQGVRTQCPVVETQCPPMETECPDEPTKCPRVPTQCPPVQTQCPAVKTECPPLLTRCPITETRCPVTETSCPPAETECPTMPTMCPVIETMCSATPSETQCPVIMTLCPVTETECPSYETRCPVESTKCPTYGTRCPPEPTMCPPVPTQCPVENTICPESETNCPVVQTQCPASKTVCPPMQTNCPENETTCPAHPTVCPVDPSPTFCPVDPTWCPPVETECPFDPTQPCQVTIFPQEPTFCPAEPTQCPDMQPTMCPEPTQCPDELTKCPPIPTQCEPEPTTQCPIPGTPCSGPGNASALNQNPKVGTRSSPVVAQCPAIDVKCPTLITKALLAKAR